MWPFTNEEPKVTPIDIANVELQSPLNDHFPLFRFYNDKFHEFLRKNMPIGFEQRLEATTPYIFAGFISWPLYWIYRGVEWKNHRNMMTLPLYIQKTYMNAKLMQFTIIIMGITLGSLMQDDNSLKILETSSKSN